MTTTRNATDSDHATRMSIDIEKIRQDFPILMR